MITVTGIMQKETDKAILLRHADGCEEWWPKSKLSPIRSDGKMLCVAVPTWLAEQKGIDGDDGDFGALVRMQEKERQANERRLQASSAEVTALSVPCPEGRAYLPYQVAGIEYVEQAKGRALVADAPGLGKTIQALGYLNLHPELRPAIVVCPASVKINWFLEARRWLMMPRGTIDVIRDGQDEPISGHDLYVINYDLVHKHEAALRGVGAKVLILDESHYIKTAKSLRTNAVLALCSDIARVICLSGTPIMNKPIEAWTTLHMLAPRTFGSWYEYVVKFCKGYQQKIGRDRKVWIVDGASNLDELNRLLRGSCMVRRRKEDVLAQLPAKRRVIVPIGNGGRVKGEAEFVRKLKTIMKRRRADQRKLALVTDDGARAKRKASMLARMREENTEILGEIEALRQEAAQVKLDAAIEFIENIAEQGKVVVFAHHKFVISALVGAFKGAAVIRGETAAELRQKEVERFQTDERCRVFIGSLHAASQGITLTAASDVVFVELDWVPGICTQGEDRTHRIGQHDSVTAWYLVLDESIEVRMAKILERKQAILDAALDGKAAEASGSIFDDLIAEVGEEGDEGKDQ